MKFHSVGENHLYVKAYKNGIKTVCRDVVVYIMKDKHASLLMKAHPKKEKVNRIGITVTKKIGGAVVRTRARRVIREAYRLTEKEYDVKKGYIIIFVARNSVTNAKSSDVKEQLTNALTSRGLIARSTPEKRDGQQQ